MARKEQSYWRDLTFNVFHREWPGLYNTDADNVEFIYRKETPTEDATPHAVAIVDHKSDAAIWCKREKLLNGEKIIIVQPSIKGLYDLARRASLPLYVATHNADFSIWTIYVVKDFSTAEVFKSDVRLKAFVDWLYELHGKKALEAIRQTTSLSAFEKQKLERMYNTLERIDQKTRDDYLSRGIEFAYNQLSTGAMMRLGQRLMNATFNRANKEAVIPLLDEKEKSA